MTVPRTAEIWRKVLESRLARLHTALPCEVISFDASAQTVVCQPLIKSVEIDLDGNEIEESYPQLRDVPICWPRAGGFVVAYPLAAGDIVTVLLHEWDLGNFLETGSEDRPLILERHGLSGAAALPLGPYPYANPVSETVDGLVIGEDGGAVIRIKDDGTVAIGASGSTMQAVALADDVKAEIEALRDAIANAAPVPNDGGAAVISQVGAHVVGAVGSSVAEVEE